MVDTPRRYKKENSVKYTSRVLIYDSGRILLVRERGAHHWSLPGGGIKHDETPAKAAAREVKEELNVNVDNLQYLGSVRGRGHRIHQLFLADGYTGNLRPSSWELEGCRWYNMRDRINISYHTKEAIKRALDLLGLND